MISENKQKYIVYAGIFCVAFLMGFATNHGTSRDVFRDRADLRDDVASKAAEIETLSATTADLNGQLEKAGADLTAAAGEIEAAETELVELRDAIKDEKANTTVANERANAIQAELDAAKADLASASRQVESFQGELNVLETKLAEEESKIGFVLADLEKAKEHASEHEAKSIGLVEQISALENEVAAVTEANATLIAEVSNKDQVIEKLTEQLAEAGNPAPQN